jgi:hypothetical protein
VALAPSLTLLYAEKSGIWMQGITMHPIISDYGSFIGLKSHHLYIPKNGKVKPETVRVVGVN